MDPSGAYNTALAQHRTANFTAVCYIYIICHIIPSVSCLYAAHIVWLKAFSFLVINASGSHHLSNCILFNDEFPFQETLFFSSKFAFMALHIHSIKSMMTNHVTQFLHHEEAFARTHAVLWMEWSIGWGTWPLRQSSFCWCSLTQVKRNIQRKSKEIEVDGWEITRSVNWMAYRPQKNKRPVHSKEQFCRNIGTTNHMEQTRILTLVPSTHELGSLFTKEKREGTTTEESGEIWGAPLAKQADRNATASWTGRINT